MVALTEGFLAFVKLLDGVLVGMKEAGILRPNLNLNAIRSALMGMLEGMLRDRFLAERLGFPTDTKMEQVPQMLDLVLRSLLAT